MFFKKKKESDVDVLSKIKEKIADDENLKTAANDNGDHTNSDEDFLNDILTDYDQQSNTTTNNNSEKQQVLDDINTVVSNAIKNNNTETEDIEQYMSEDGLLEDLLSDNEQNNKQSTEIDQESPDLAHATNTATDEQNHGNDKMNEMEESTDIENMNYSSLEDDGDIDNEDEDEDEDEENISTEDLDNNETNDIDDVDLDSDSLSEDPSLPTSESKFIAQEKDSATVDDTNFNSYASLNHDRYQNHPELNNENYPIYPNARFPNLPNQNNVDNNTINHVAAQKQMSRGYFNPGYTVDPRNNHQYSYPKVSNRTRQNVKSSITDLIENVKNQMLTDKRQLRPSKYEHGKTIEQFLTDLMQPKIIEYLNDNLDGIVRDIVNKEIKKIINDTDIN